MKYAIYLPNFGSFGDARVLADLAHDAEHAGWDGFFIWDHIASEHPIPVVDPWVALAAIALSTERMRIGTTVTPIPRRRPWKLARETVSVDRLSGGRLTLGVGIGLGAHEWDYLGEEPDQGRRGAMLDEGLDVLAGLWSGQPFSYAGQHYHITEARFLPTPVQQPRIPVWVGGFWPNKAPMRRAARWDGVFPLVSMGPVAPDEELRLFRACVAYVLEQRAQQAISGPFDVIALGATAPYGAPHGVVADYAEAGATWWLEPIVPWRFGQDGQGDWPFDRMRERVLQGPPTG
ncbi:MAG: LLM class flavin-dependent oxidoreductase [Chloroflexi bacterium]|nr:LLM class flavin-dependent oxidoreductase [Chloroflexota bacterium]